METVGQKPDIIALAYGVQPIYPTVSGGAIERHNGYATVHAPTGYLHYWVDSAGQYHETLRDVPEIPVVVCYWHGNIECTLNGPRDYRINTREATR